MAGVFKRATDKARGKDGKYTCWWIGADGRKHSKAGTTDKAHSLEIAREEERRARLEKSGMFDRAAEKRREESLRAPSSHLEDYRRELLAKGDTKDHVRHTVGAIRRILEDATITSVAEIAPDRIRGALGRLRAVRSARTCNHALGALKGFSRWLYDAGRIAEVPRGLAKIAPYPEKGDRRLVRRALSPLEVSRLLEAAEAGPSIVTRRRGRGGLPIAMMTGPERAMAYRVAMATGFRAEEIRTLTPERFHLEGVNPTITVLAGYSKRGKRSGRDDVQMIRRDVADTLRAWIASRPPGSDVFPLPEKTAEMLAADLERAGIKPMDSKGRVADFHALRHSYITGLSNAGLKPKAMQKLARHSTITLTLDRYTHLEDDDLRDALEGPCTTNAPSKATDLDPS